MDEATRRKYLTVLGFQIFDYPSDDAIKKRWKDLCKIHHPDKGGDVEEFRRVTHAYKMLTDPEYAYNDKGEPTINLDFRIQFPVAFEEAVFGATFRFTYNVMCFSESGAPTRSDVLEEDSVGITIEKGEMLPQEITIPGKGCRKGNTRGNAILIPGVLQHPQFAIQKRHNAYDILSIEEVPLSVLLKGGMARVRTVYGERKIRIAPGTPPGSRLVIEGGGTKGGNHLVEVRPIFPQPKDLKGKEWEGLAIDWEQKDVEDDVEAGELLSIYNRMKTGGPNGANNRPNKGSRNKRSRSSGSDGDSD